MKFIKITIYLLTIGCLVMCKKETNKIPQMNITKKKWLVYDNTFQSSWNGKLMPTVLNFENNKVALNFSNSFHEFSILENDLHIDGKSAFKIMYNENNTLTLNSDGDVRNYFALPEGKFTDLDKSTFEKIISSKEWVFKNLNAKFHNREIDFNNNNGEFIKSGIYSTVLYNKEILMFVNVDGDTEKETYLISFINKDKLILKKIIGKNDYETIELVGSVPN